MKLPAYSPHDTEHLFLPEAVEFLENKRRIKEDLPEPEPPTDHIIEINIILEFMNIFLIQLKLNL